jgi:acetyl-CoA C-acetyltransferase
MREVVICEPLRTPVGRFGGVFRSVPAADLATTVMTELLVRTSISAGDIDDVVMGQCYPNGEAPAIGRVIGLNSGLDVCVPGLQVDRRCGSGLQSVLYAAMCVQTNTADLVLAGGTESMSQAEFYSSTVRWGVRGDSLELVDRLGRARTTAGGRKHPIAGGMIETAENLRHEFDISRTDQDKLSVASHERAIAAQRDGKFSTEIAPVAVPQRSGSVTLVTEDEHPRPDVTLERLGSLVPIMIDSDPDATVTAGNASGQNDGAAVCVVTHRAKAEELNLRPMARLVSWATAGVAPERMGMGPVPATERALVRAGMKLSDLDLIELNEAFAAQVLAVTLAWGFGPKDFERLNVNGSGISLGHPAGATGARILSTLLHEMHRRDVRYGLETMCIGGGQGIAAIFERL